jgi:competence protein ComGC
LVISVLLIVTIPNVAKHNASIKTKGCEAYVKMVESQVQAYYIENQKYPTTVQELITAGYVNSKSACPASTNIVIDANGGVTTTTSET